MSLITIEVVFAVFNEIGSFRNLNQPSSCTGYP